MDKRNHFYLSKEDVKLIKQLVESAASELQVEPNSDNTSIVAKLRSLAFRLEVRDGN
jgi:hypothetical protein